jgi:molybdate transport system substrate-binding protein
MHRIWVMAGFLPLVLVTNLTGCSWKLPSASLSSLPGHPTAGSIVVFAAASLKPAFALIAGPVGLCHRRPERR